MNEDTPISWRRRFSVLLMVLFVLATPVGAGLAFGVGIGVLILGLVSLIASYITGVE